MLSHSIYDRVGILMLSKDGQGEVWAHLGVEFTGERPELTLLGNSTSLGDRPFLTSIEVVLTNLHEESLGVYDQYLSAQLLSNPEKTYSYAYTNPRDKTSTLIFALMIEHPEDIESLHAHFDRERTIRLNQENNQKFTHMAQTKIKQLRVVKWKQIKNYVDLFIHGDFIEKDTILSAEKSTTVRDVDPTQVLDVLGEIQYYEILKDDKGNPLGIKLPREIPLNNQSANSVSKLLPGLEQRLLGEPLIKNEKMSSGFYGKAIRTDEYSFIDDFISNLPVEGLPDIHRKGFFRKGRRPALTSRGTEMIDRKLRKEYGIAKQYTESEKSQFTSFQSLSYFSVAAGTPVFGWQKERGARLLGVAEIDVLPNRLYIYDGGTVGRPYDGVNKKQLLYYIQDKVLSEHNVLFDISEIEDFKKAIRNTKDEKHNEILGRIRWQVNKSSICVFSHNQETRWIAIDWAKKLDQKIHRSATKFLADKTITQEEHDKYLHYRTPITFYHKDKKVTGHYTVEQLEEDAQQALKIFRDKSARLEYLKLEDFEFLLLVNEEADLLEILNDELLMKNLLSKKLYIAESLIDKYHAKTGKNILIKDVANLKLLNVTRSLLEKIHTDIITGFPRDAHGRIIFQGYTILNKDLSQADFSNFNFSHTQFRNVYFNEAKLNIREADNVTFDNCDFSGVPTHQLDFSNSSIEGDFIVKGDEPDFKIMRKIKNISAYFDNFKSATIMALIRKNNHAPSAALLLFGLTIAYREKALDDIKELDYYYDVFKKSGLLKPDLYLKLAVEQGDIDLLNRVMLKFPEIKMSDLKVDGQSLLFTDMQFNQLTMVEYLINLGFDVNSQDNKGNTLFLKAAKKGNVFLMSLLIRNGAKADHLNNSNQSALELATMTGNNLNYEVAQYILFVAIENHNYILAEKLLAKYPTLALGVRTDSKYQGHNAYTFALKVLKANNFTFGFKLSQFPVFKLIQLTCPEAQFHVTQLNDDHTTLTFAIRNKNLEWVAGIISRYKGNLLDLLNFRTANLSPLIAAIQSMDDKIVDFLIRQGADVNVATLNGHTPLEIALQKNNINVLSLLIKAGADLQIKNSEGLTPLEQAKITGAAEIIELIEQSLNQGPVRSKEVKRPMIFSENKSEPTPRPDSDNAEEPVKRPKK